MNLLEFFRRNKIKAYDPYQLTFYTPTFRWHMSRDMKFPTLWYVRPAKPRISLRKPAV